MSLQTKTIINGVNANMTQGALPFKYEQEKKGLGLTALAGLPLYLDMAQVMDLAGSIDRHVTVRKDSQGWTDSQVVMCGW